MKNNAQKAVEMRPTASNLRKSQRMYVIRSLNQGNIKAIGYDMDHTLAVYNRENFETLAFRETLLKFIENGYPEELLKLKFDPNFVQRGLLVDRQRGNLLKVDCHKYVKLAYHGHTKLSKEDRHKIYNSKSYRAQDFLSVDTFFALSEVQLFTEIVDYMNKFPKAIQKSFEEVYADLRLFIDESHRDGSIKDKVLKNPELYFIRDKHLATTLVRQIDGGKTLFLLTNSQWPYTNAVMEYVLGNDHEYFSSWRDFFQYVIVGAEKPDFFTGSQPFLEVLTDSNYFKRIKGPLKSESVYMGGNARLFEKLTKFTGDEILYIGDHIYGDIMTSKDSLNWRTALIVEELEQEMDKLEELEPIKQKIISKLNEKEALEESSQILRSRVTANEHQIKIAKKKNDTKKINRLTEDNQKLQEQVNELHDELSELNQTIDTMIAKRSQTIHPIWGELMKTGFENSRFANQVRDYACIYTSRVSNFRFYSQNKVFIATYEAMPHEF